MSHGRGSTLITPTSLSGHQGGPDQYQEGRYEAEPDPDDIHRWAVPGFSKDHVIAEGGCSSVWLGHALDGSDKVAIKVADKKSIGQENLSFLKREVEALQLLAGHPCIVKLLTTHDTGDYLYIVTEFLPGGTLLDYIKRQKTLQKSEAARIVAQLAGVLQYCHKKGVVHRDIKLENIMMDKNCKGVKLIDFGLCDFFVPGQKLNISCGTRACTAPEITVQQEYEGPPVDVWGLGVCLYEMLVGASPFPVARDLLLNIVSGSFTLPMHLDESPVSSLIFGMLSVDPDTRMTLSQVLDHPWLKEGKSPSVYDHFCSFVKP